MHKRQAILWLCLLIILTALVISLLGLITHRDQLGKLWRHLPTKSTPAPGFYKVVEVYDGDTIAVDMAGTTEKVRFIGVDTPETHKPNTPVQCFGPEASSFTTKLLSVKTVRLEADADDQNRDIYGRLLRYVYTEDGTLVNRRLIERGYGFIYTLFPFSKKADFKLADNEAENSKVGLWSACGVTKDGNKYQTVFP